MKANIIFLRLMFFSKESLIFTKSAFFIQTNKQTNSNIVNYTILNILFSILIYFKNVPPVMVKRNFSRSIYYYIYYYC